MYIVQVVLLLARYLALTPQMHQSHQKRKTQEAQLNCKLDVS